MNIPASHPGIPPLKVLAFCCLAACGGQQDGIPDTTPKQGQQVDTRSLLTPDQQVKKGELECLENDMARFFGFSVAGQPPVGLTQPNIALAVASLQLELQAIRSTPGYDDKELAMRITHGLLVDGSTGRYMPEISFGILTFDQGYSWDWTPINGRVFAVDGDHALVPVPAGANYSATYMAHMRVDRHMSGNFDIVLATKDVTSYTFAVEAVEQVIKDNDPSSAFIELVSIAEYDVRDPTSPYAGMRHHVCLVVNNMVMVRQLDDTSHTPVFKMKGLDVGSPCPPYCMLAYLPKQGVPLRTDCP